MKALTPPQDLYPRIIEQINYERQLRELKRKLLWYAVALTGSLASLALLFRDFLTQASQSGLLNFLSLLRSDFTAVRIYFADYLLSLAESLPAVSFGLMALALLLTLACAIKLADYGAQYRHLPHA